MKGEGKVKQTRFYLFGSLLVFGCAAAWGQTTFSNIMDLCGINFVHQLDGTCSQPPVNSGSAWGDYDLDGDMDFYIANHGGPSGLYRNEGDTNGDGITEFTDVAPSLGVDETGQVKMAACFVDYDNDGDQDLIVLHWGGNTLFQNRLVETGTVEFLDVTDIAGVRNGDRPLTAAWGDYDQDGWLDLYLVKHFDCVPNTRETRDALYHNNGDGTFTNVSQYLCADGSLTCIQLNESHGFTAGWFDFDNDNDLDLYLISDVFLTGYPNVFWRNDGPDIEQGGWIFTDISAESLTDYAVNGMGLGVGDYDNDGLIDIAFSHTVGGFLLRNLGDGTFDDVSDEAGVRGLTTPLGDVAITWATVFFDYDNDQWKDLFFVRGMISGNPTPQPDVLYRNNHDGTFEDVTVVAGLGDDRRGRSASICDFDNDGFVDLFVGNYGWPCDLWHNESRSQGNTNHWLKVTAQGIGDPTLGIPVTNRDGIGARFYLTTPDGITQIWEISSGPTVGGGDDKAAYFGLGTNTEAELVVRWPTGEVDTLGTVQADQHIHVVETPPDDVGDKDPIASRFELSQNYPNPFNPTTVITYSVPVGSAVSLKVFDALGREVTTLVSDYVPAGRHLAKFDATSLSSGTYFYRLVAGSFTETKKLVLVK
jgi:hypothetical protein